jgi:hypothetical protein
LSPPAFQANPPQPVPPPNITSHGGLTAPKIFLMNANYLLSVTLKVIKTAPMDFFGLAVFFLFFFVAVRAGV